MTGKSKTSAASTSEQSGFRQRIPLVGRRRELARLEACLHARGDRHYVYYWAYGGLGKTRLLEELEQVVRDAGPGYHTSGIIDLYHTDTHSNSDVERAIVEGLDPERHYFSAYREERDRYLRLRERGADPGELESRREKLSGLFVQEFNLMAQEARKLVVCFDTVELLQYESSVVEERAALDQIDTRLKPWMLKTLKQLRNVLVVLAGRPRQPLPDEQSEPQARLVRDLQDAFEAELAVVELLPLSLAETEQFVQTLPGGAQVLPAPYVPVVHRLTGGRPIFLHLVIDLLHPLSLEPGRILALFDQWVDLVAAEEGDARLQAAQRQIQREILLSIHNDAGERGGYLGRMALMPKGVDPEILNEALGLPLDEATRLLTDLAPLSFVKQFKRSPALVDREPSAEQHPVERLHVQRTFLHDEMYRLLTQPGVMPNVRMNERAMAHALAYGYYRRRIADLQEEIARPHTPEERIPLRERLQKLQVERLYYLLVQDPREGYREYRELSDQANRDRQVGFAMRLLDEFLRFYNTPERRRQFAAAGIPDEQVVRESTLLWMERFHWWALYDRAVRLAGEVLAEPAAFAVHADDLGIVGNLYALWVRDRAVLYGFEQATVDRALPVLERLRSRAHPTDQEVLARARLATSIGFMFDLGGLLVLAEPYYVEAKAAFKRLGRHPDELAMLLNNMAYLYATQGRMMLARTLAREALQINERLGNNYSTGLTLSTLANVETRQGNYLQATGYAEEALRLFQDLEDARGTSLALLAIAQARRKMAKYEMQKGRKLEEARAGFLEAESYLSRAIEAASRAGLVSELPKLHAKLGKVYRELGTIVAKQEGLSKGLVYYGRSEDEFNLVLAAQDLSKLDRVDTLVDFAEALFVAGFSDKAGRQLARFEAELGPEYGHLSLGIDLSQTQVPPQYFRPLGKAERLRGQMALDQGRAGEALRHFAAAYDCFVHFSATASEKDNMVELLYDRLRDLPLGEQQQLLDDLRGWVRELPQHDEMDIFIGTMGDLLGV